MKTVLLLVGKTQNKIFRSGIDDYVSRIGHYMPFNVTTIPELKNTKSLSEDQQRQKEGELILKEIQTSDTVVLLDERGKEFRSVEFAEYIPPALVPHWRTVWILTRCLCTCQRLRLIIPHDVFPPDGASHLCRTALPCLHDH